MTAKTIDDFQLLQQITKVIGADTAATHTSWLVRQGCCREHPCAKLRVCESMDIACRECRCRSRRDLCRIHEQMRRGDSVENIRGRVIADTTRWIHQARWAAQLSLIVGGVCAYLLHLADSLVLLSLAALIDIVIVTPGCLANRCRQ